MQFLILLDSESADLYKLDQVVHCFWKGMCLVTNTKDFFNLSLFLFSSEELRKRGTSEKTASVSKGYIWSCFR